VKLIEYEQPTSLPVPKVAAAGIAGVIVTAVVTVLALSGIIVPDNVSQAAVNAVAAVIFLISAVQTVVTFAAGYFKKDARPAPVVDEIRRTQVK
jgi:predicted membrane channel-forming protein YqfA (hemolysin III family)